MKRVFSWGCSRVGRRIVATLATSGSASARAGDPITKGPWMQHVTSTSAVVRVEVDPPAPVTIEVGSRRSARADAGPGASSRAARCVALTIVVKGLEPATRYPFTVRVGGATS